MFFCDRFKINLKSITEYRLKNPCHNRIFV